MVKDKLFYIIPFLISSLLLINYLIIQYRSYLNIRRFRVTIQVNKNTVLDKLYINLLKKDFFKELLDKITTSLIILIPKKFYTTYESLQKKIFLSLILFFTGFLLYINFISNVWYEFLIYIGLMTLFLSIIYSFLNSMSRLKLVSFLPTVFKLMSSRYTMSGNIIKTIKLSLDDMPEILRYELLKIVETLNVNDRDTMEKEFSYLKKKYAQEYFTILIELIVKAHLKGGNETIKEQFESISVECLTEIEHKKKISSSVYSYICIIISLIPLWYLGKLFNLRVLPDSLSYYHSLRATNIQVIYYIFSMCSIWMLKLLEKGSE